MFPQIFLPAPAFGWDTYARTLVGHLQCRDCYCCYTDDYMEREAPFFNGLKILGYIPLLNVITGIGRIAIFSLLLDRAVEDPLSDLQGYCRFQCITHIIRGVAEVLTGPLMLIVDAIKTLYDCGIANHA